MLEGKKLLQNVMDMNGEILFTEGRILTKEDIEKAQSEGPAVLVGLSMHVES